MKTFHAIGHSTRSLSELKNLIEYQGAYPLIDIRTFPGSRRYPHFNKENLEEVLGDRYIHLPNLGGRRKATEGVVDNRAWENDSFRHYADYMQTNSFEEGMQELLAIGQGTLMCSEAVWWRCHRRMVSDALVTRGYEVIHIGVGDRPTKHLLTDFAVTDPVLHYPGKQMSISLETK